MHDKYVSYKTITGLGGIGQSSVQGFVSMAKQLDPKYLHYLKTQFKITYQALAEFCSDLEIVDEYLKNNADLGEGKLGLIWLKQLKIWLDEEGISDDQLILGESMAIDLSYLSEIYWGFRPQADSQYFIDQIRSLNREVIGTAVKLQSEVLRKISYMDKSSSVYKDLMNKWLEVPGIKGQGNLFQDHVLCLKEINEFLNFINIFREASAYGVLQQCDSTNEFISCSKFSPMMDDKANSDRRVLSSMGSKTLSKKIKEIIIWQQSYKDQIFGGLEEKRPSTSIFFADRADIPNNGRKYIEALAIGTRHYSGAWDSYTMHDSAYLYGGLDQNRIMWNELVSEISSANTRYARRYVAKEIKKLRQGVAAITVIPANFGSDLAHWQDVEYGDLGKVFGRYLPILQDADETLLVTILEQSGKNEKLIGMDLFHIMATLDELVKNECFGDLINPAQAIHMMRLFGFNPSTFKYDSAMDTESPQNCRRLDTDMRQWWINFQNSNQANFPVQFYGGRFHVVPVNTLPNIANEKIRPDFPKPAEYIVILDTLMHYFV